MKYLRLIFKNAGRSKRRTALTILSVSVSVFLLAIMKAAIDTLNNVNRTGAGVSRVVVRRNTSLADAMPEAHRDKIAQIPGVGAVCPVNWFRGIYKEENPQCCFAQFYGDTSNIFDVLSEFDDPPHKLARFNQDP